MTPQSILFLINLRFIMLMFTALNFISKLKLTKFILCSIIGSIDGGLDTSVAHSSETLLSSPQNSTNNLDIIANPEIGKNSLKYMQ